MMFGWMMAVASAASVGGGDEQVWMMPGGVDCDARDVLVEAVEDELLDLDEARRVAACGYSTALHGDVLDVFEASRNGLEAHGQEPDALAVYARAVGTIRSGLLGDGVRLALQQQIADALEGAEPGPWQEVIFLVAAREPGPMPIEDPPVFAAMLRRGVEVGPDGSTVWQWGRATAQSAFYLAVMPIVRGRVERVQQALDSREPRRELAALEAEWTESWAPTSGYVHVTVGLMDHEAELREQWRGLLVEM